MFKRILAAVFLFFALSNAAQAQDVIHTRDGRTMTVIVTDLVGNDLIFSNIGDSTQSYYIDLDEVAYVDFSENNPLLAAIYSWASISQPALDLEIERLTRKKDAGSYCALAGGMLTATGLSLAAISLLLKKTDPADSFVKTLGNVGLGCAAGGVAVMGIGLTIRGKARRALDEIYMGSTGNGFGLTMTF